MERKAFFGFTAEASLLRSERAPKVRQKLAQPVRAGKGGEEN